MGFNLVYWNAKEVVNNIKYGMVPKYEIVKIKGKSKLWAVVENKLGKKAKFKYCGSYENCEAYKSTL